MAKVGMPTTCDYSDYTDHMTMLVDSGASGHYFDDELQPSLRDKLLNYKELEKPHKIVTAERHVLLGKATRHGLWGDHRREREQTPSGPSGSSRTWAGASSVLGITGS